jgi:hypothetical protein
MNQMVLTHNILNSTPYSNSLGPSGVVLAEIMVTKEAKNSFRVTQPECIPAGAS